MDQKFLILICNVWSDGQGSDISDPYSFRVMEMDWKFHSFCVMEMDWKFPICYVWSLGYGSQVSDPYL